jgi:hypothetical protein
MVHRDELTRQHQKVLGLSTWASRMGAGLPQVALLFETCNTYKSFAAKKLTV